MHYRDAFPRLVSCGIALAIAVEATRGFDVHGASAVRAVLLVGTCLYGGWLYYLQRAHVMWLVTSKRAPPLTSPTGPP
jgi:hypothetical protein